MAVEKARQMAREVELDLVEVAPNVHPPVCKIMDFGKYLYEQKKQDQKHKKLQKQAEVKGVRLTFRIGEHDLETKAAQAKRFLKDRNMVKVSMMLRGREFAHMDLAREKLEKFATLLQDAATVDQPPKKTGNTFIMMLSPAR